MLNREQHMVEASAATVDVLAAESKLSSMRVNLESKLLSAVELAEIETQRQLMHDQLDIVLDAISRQKVHMRAAMLARW